MICKVFGEGTEYDQNICMKKCYTILKKNIESYNTEIKKLRQKEVKDS